MRQAEMYPIPVRKNIVIDSEKPEIKLTPVDLGHVQAGCMLPGTAWEFPIPWSAWDLPPDTRRGGCC